MKKYLLFVIFLNCSLMGTLKSQEKTFKEIKTITLEEDYNDGDKILIYGERTVVNIKSWNRDIVSLKADMISRYKDQAQAIVDLEKMNLSFTKSGNKIVYNNAVRIKSANEKPLSNMKVEIELFVPVNANVMVENKFGEININADLSDLNIDSEFSGITILNSNSTCNINSSYGDVVVERSTLDLTLKSDRSNLLIDEMLGSINAEIDYGEIIIAAHKDMVIKKIKGKYSPMSITLADGNNQKLDVSCEDCKIDASELLNAKTSSKNSISNIVINGTGTPKGTIYSIIEDITIK